MITTLLQAIYHFKLDSLHYQERIDNITKLTNEDRPLNIPLINTLKDLRDGTADKATIIAYVLNHIAYKKILIKYDILDANTFQVVIHYKNPPENNW